MKMKNILISIVLFMSIGCIGIYEVPPDPDPDPVNNDVYVNTYVSMPYTIREIIAPYVRGYFSPRLHRYCEYLYPSNTPYDPYDLPCYVRADFNGDGFYDYAFLFSMEEWDCCYWYLTTKLLVVLSTPYGYELSCDLILGTVYAENDIPIEEYWSICYLPPGYHTLVTWINGVEIIETVYLPNDAFFLASLDPNDESIFFAEGNAVYEIEWEEERLSKRNTDTIVPTREKKKFEKNIEGRKRMILKK